MEPCHKERMTDQPTPDRARPLQKLVTDQPRDAVRDRMALASRVTKRARPTDALSDRARAMMATARRQLTPGQRRMVEAIDACLADAGTPPELLALSDRTYEMQRSRMAAYWLYLQIGGVTDYHVLAPLLARERSTLYTTLQSNPLRLAQATETYKDVVRFLAARGFLEGRRAG